MAARRHFVHFIKVFLKFGSFTSIVWSWNLHTFRALFIAVHIHFYFLNKIFNMAAKRHFLHFCHVFLLFGAFKAILSKYLSWFYVYWFLKLPIQQKCWHQQKNCSRQQIFFIMYFYVSGHFEYFYFCWFSKVFGRKLLKSAALISEFTAFNKAFSLVIYFDFVALSLRRSSFQG